MNLRSARKLFTRSPRTNRPVSLFNWNDHAGVSQIEATAGSISDAGSGGILLRPGAGVPPDFYLGEQWHEGAVALARAFRKRRASIWLEEDFDSDHTKGHVARVLTDRPEFAAVHLVMREVASEDDFDLSLTNADRIAMFVVPGDSTAPLPPCHDDAEKEPNADAGQPYRVAGNTDPSQWPGHRVLVFEQATVGDSINLFQSGAVEALLDRTHGTYYEAAKRFFGNTLGLCILSNVGFATGDHAIPWDPELAGLFHDTRGYSIVPHLPALFLDTPGCEAVRYDYWTLVADMFTEGFARPYKTWCEERRIPCTASVRACSQVDFPLMPLHALQDFPCVTIPRRHDTNEDPTATENDLVEIKQAASAKRQFDKGGLVNTGLAALPDGLSFQQRKGDSNRNLALGVNYALHHAAFTSLRGDRKRDAGSFIGPHDPRWGMAQQYNDALSRSAWLLSQGAAQCPVLLLHPASSLQALHMPASPTSEDTVGGASARADAIAKHLRLISESLVSARIDFDFGDEELLARHGQVSEKNMVLGSHDYRIVVVPPMINMRSATLSLLHDFCMVGGRLIFAGTVPTLIDGRPSPDVDKFAEEYGERILQGIDLFDYSALVQRLDTLDARLVSVADGPGGDALRVQKRRWDDIEYTFITNVSSRAVQNSLTLVPDINGHVEEWDPDTGAIRVVGNCEAGVPLTTPFECEPGQATFLVALPGEEKNIPPRPTLGHVFRSSQPDWYGVPASANLLPLQECRVVTDEDSGEWGNPEEARGLIGVALAKAKGPVPMRIQWRLHVSEQRPPTGAVEAVLELSQDATVSLNGHEVPTEDAETFLDPAFSLVPLPPLKPNENIIEVWRLYTTEDDLQPPWVRGPFEALPGSVVAERQGPLALGTWADVGLPHYTGAVIYRTEIKGYELYDDDRVFLDFGGLNGVAEVRVNGESMDRALWIPNRAEVTRYWKPGDIKIEIEVVGGTTNLFCTRQIDADSIPPVPYGLLTPPEIKMIRSKGVEDPESPPDDESDG